MCSQLEQYCPKGVKIGFWVGGLVKEIFDITRVWLSKAQPYQTKVSLHNI